MPIKCGVEVALIDQEKFHSIDQLVMRNVFDMHNSMGRFCDERIYQEELARRCRDAGFQVEREVHLQVSHRNFFKSYYLDMLIDHGGIYELKVAETIDESHQKQVINYLLLVGLRHGKLVNLRPASVESRFVSTNLCRQSRAEFRVIVEEFEEATDSDQLLRKTLCALLDDWGAFLDANLYREALLHFLNGPKAGIQPVEIVVDGHSVGTQKMCVLNDETAWHLSAIRTHVLSYETHLSRLLRHTRLQRIHWINFYQRKITLRTLKNNSADMAGENGRMIYSRMIPGREIEIPE